MCFASGERDEVTIEVPESGGAPGTWWFYQQPVQNESVLTVCSPADAAIGRYHLVVLIVNPDGDVVGRKDNVRFHLLFNPWCKGEVTSISQLHYLRFFIIH